MQAVSINKIQLTHKLKYSHALLNATFQFRLLRKSVLPIDTNAASHFESFLQTNKKIWGNWDSLEMVSSLKPNHHDHV
jgi:hypothetical protein